MTRFARLAAISLFALLALAPLRAQTRIAIPSYQDPGSPVWDAWAAPGRDSVGLMIVNENNGDDTTYYDYVDAGIRATRKRGIFVIGYVHTTYGQRDLADLKQKVDGVFQDYLVDGIFFDEVPTDCNGSNPQSGSNYAYYTELAEYVRRRQTGGRLVLLNPGTQPANDCWMSIANILVTAESSSLADYQQNYQDQPWFYSYPPDRFWHIVYTVNNASELQTILALSKARNAGWIYVTDQALPNPYAQTPSFWQLETNTIASQPIQSPYAWYRPAAMDDNGNPVPSRTSFRWTAPHGYQWQLFLSTDLPDTKWQSNSTDISIRPDYLLTVSSSHADLYHYSGSGSDWKWTKVHTDIRKFIPSSHVHTVELDSAALNGAHSLQYQIRALNSSSHPLGSSGVWPLSLTNTQYVFDLSNH